MMDSIGHLFANHNITQSVIYAPVAFSSTKGHRGTLEAATSEAIIMAAFFEAMHSFSLVANTNNWKHRSIHVVRGVLFLTVMVHESMWFFPKAQHHWDKYSQDLQRNGAQPVTSLAHSIAAISAMVLIVKFLAAKTRIGE
jgi:hypothetical protein